VQKNAHITIIHRIITIYISTKLESSVSEAAGDGGDDVELPQGICLLLASSVQHPWQRTPSVPSYVTISFEVYVVSILCG